MGKESNIKLVKDTFTEENTNQFLVELDLVIKTIDYVQMERLLIRYGIQDDPECIIFVDTIKDLFENWKIEGGESILVDHTETRVTKCFACFFGKSVTAYEFSYQHKCLLGYESRNIYAREFAVFTDIKNNCLVDFGVCNAFLNRDEVQLLE